MARIRPEHARQAQRFMRRPPERFESEREREERLDQQAKYAEPPETDADPLDD